MTKEKSWNDDINAESVSKASEILPKIALPQPGEPAIIVAVNEEPYMVLDNEKREMFVGEVFQKYPSQISGTMVYPKSLRFNIAKALKRAQKDFRKASLSGLTFKVWSIEDNGQKFYQAELYVPPATENQ